MAYNLFAESKSAVDWLKVNSQLLIASRRCAEFIPAPGMGLNGNDAIIVSIRQRLENIEIQYYTNEISDVIKILLELDFVVFDLYQGSIIDNNNLEQLIDSLS